VRSLTLLITGEPAEFDSAVSETALRL